MCRDSFAFQGEARLTCRCHMFGSRYSTPSRLNGHHGCLERSRHLAGRLLLQPQRTPSPYPCAVGRSASWPCRCNAHGHRNTGDVLTAQPITRTAVRFAQATSNHAGPADRTMCSDPGLLQSLGFGSAQEVQPASWCNACWGWPEPVVPRLPSRVPEARHTGRKMDAPNAHFGSAECCSVAFQMVEEANDQRRIEVLNAQAAGVFSAPVPRQPKASRRRKVSYNAMVCGLAFAGHEPLGKNACSNSAKLLGFHCLVLHCWRRRVANW